MEQIEQKLVKLANGEWEPPRSKQGYPFPPSLVPSHPEGMTPRSPHATAPRSGWNSGQVLPRAPLTAPSSAEGSRGAGKKKLWEGRRADRAGSPPSRRQQRGGGSGAAGGGWTSVRPRNRPQPREPPARGGINLPLEGEPDCYPSPANLCLVFS